MRPEAIAKLLRAVIATRDLPKDETAEHITSKTANMLEAAITEMQGTKSGISTHFLSSLNLWMEHRTEQRKWPAIKARLAKSPEGNLYTCAYLCRPHFPDASLPDEVRYNILMLHPIFEIPSKNIYYLSAFTVEPQSQLRSNLYIVNPDNDHQSTLETTLRKIHQASTKFELTLTPTSTGYFVYAYTKSNGMEERIKPYSLTYLPKSGLFYNLLVEPKQDKSQQKQASLRHNLDPTK